MTPPDRPVPSALRTAVRQWRENGEPPQRASSWSRGSWLKYFPGRQAFLDSLPDSVDRAEAARHAADAVTPEGAEQAFLVAMIWGYGPVGYGPWRTARVLTENPHAADRLAEVAVVARDSGGLDAFRALAHEPLRYLGVAFGTKYLRFVTAALPVETAPILDAVVRRWLAAHTGWHPNIDEWRPAVYEKYVAWLTAWSTEFDLDADMVEQMIFGSAITQEGSALWGEQWASTAGSPARMARAALLDLHRLFETADSQAALEAREHLDELDRIIQRGWTM
ncbi:8-oxoguanine DNA glycosylase OGG fold protein [Amycolatopsis azurea]|uniref:Uncharacterized protein n=1 Tax=Amycolatopsis azurea DSM 43854 TaxID=1238180 RepID=M2QNW6_9PSEU|nr:hypothetical protein [Amycolatopsis azurea]EMD28366.1 hypothetical protein C791_1040 [Amycolatopsis azurea DSM 43854]OOC06585.1 hypothetical protein B0293_11090 [Amycolatopsis azurea DSM 43854]